MADEALEMNARSRRDSDGTLPSDSHPPPPTRVSERQARTQAHRAVPHVRTVLLPEDGPHDRRQHVQVRSRDNAFLQLEKLRQDLENIRHKLWTRARAHDRNVHGRA